LLKPLPIDSCVGLLVAQAVVNPSRTVGFAGDDRSRSLSKVGKGRADLFGFWAEVGVAAAASAESLIPRLSAGERSKRSSRAIRELVGVKEGLWPSAWTPVRHQIERWKKGDQGEVREEEGEGREPV
jgi:hypothetical protein